jgi:hypothetical protein
MQQCGSGKWAVWAPPGLLPLALPLARSPFLSATWSAVESSDFILFEKVYLSHLDKEGKLMSLTHLQWEFFSFFVPDNVIFLALMISRSAKHKFVCKYSKWLLKRAEFKLVSKV